MLTLGFIVGKEDGKLDIDGLMDKDGCPDGMLVGQMDTLGFSEGKRVGSRLGRADGCPLGVSVG